jgi:hypothetical protein
MLLREYWVPEKPGGRTRRVGWRASYSSWTKRSRRFALPASRSPIDEVALLDQLTPGGR